MENIKLTKKSAKGLMYAKGSNGDVWLTNGAWVMSARCLDRDQYNYALEGPGVFAAAIGLKYKKGLREGNNCGVLRDVDPSALMETIKRQIDKAKGQPFEAYRSTGWVKLIWSFDGVEYASETGKLMYLNREYLKAFGLMGRVWYATDPLSAAFLAIPEAAGAVAFALMPIRG